jgi:quinolinate synthase
LLGRRERGRARRGRARHVHELDRGLKAFVGRHGGAVCTSSNARAVLEWAFRRKPRVLFFPDQHLGRNTGYRMGIPLEQHARLGSLRERRRLSAQQIRDARVLLWKGHCSVHNRFTPEMVDQRRAEIPGVKVIVHPSAASRWRRRPTPSARPRGS